jgi:RNA recognition motif-containing protein
MQRTIYVGNLSAQTTMEDLDGLFSQHGEVTNVSVVRDRYSGASRGFAYVEMRSVEAATAAIAALDLAELGGRHIVVKTADDSRRRKAGQRR